jgi:multicomponent Na+:H+ antiporter subunit G
MHMRLAADIMLLIGAAFAFLGALGILRMPDVYNRIQAGTKAVTLGALAFLLGLGLLETGWWAKLVCIGGFILFTNPVSSSTIARALYISGVRPWRAPAAANESGG